MPAAYTTAQKAAISQFQSITNTDRNTAAKHLKASAWNTESAANRFFSNPGSSSSTAKSPVAALNKIFDKYREDAENSPDEWEMNGIMKYLQDIDVDPEGLDCLAVMEIVKAPSIGEFQREGFVTGWSALNCDSLKAMKAHADSIRRILPTSKDTFTKVYQHAFQLLRANALQKAITLDMAEAYWSLLFASPLSPIQWTSASSPWLDWWIEYIKNVYKRSINRDVWNQTLKFAQATLEDPSLGFWNEEASWPSVIDDFVAWVKKEKRGEREAEDMEE